MVRECSACSAGLHQCWCNAEPELDILARLLQTKFPTQILIIDKNYELLLSASLRQFVRGALVVAHAHDTMRVITVFGSQRNMSMNIYYIYIYIYLSM